MFRKMISKVQQYQERINLMSRKKKIICLIGLCIVFPEEMIIILISYKIFRKYTTYKALKAEIDLLKISNSYLEQEIKELRQNLNIEVNSE